MGYGSRLPTSNDIPRGESNPWGPGELEDDFLLLVSRTGARCSGCSRVTKKRFLEDGLCPDCYKNKNGKESPAIGRERRQYFYDNIGCASGEDGEAD